MEFSFYSEDIKLHLTLMEVDNYDPNTLRFAVYVDLSHPTGAFSYSASDIWLTTEMWNLFETEVENDIKKPAHFHDQSNYFNIIINKGQKKLEIKINIKEPLTTKGDMLFSSVHELDIDSAFLDQLRNSLKSFPKFW